ncbi:MAG: cyclic nucleotide-binding domain-containing protein [bacterium]|nr:cyclic nucleotide-binding domain-containing protein [bacterium]MDT8396567.1 cyclic nucleotide-binding domain-containing protein [bacterium]
MAKIKPLRQSKIFSSLTDRELALFSRIVSEEKYIQDTVLVAENMRSDKFYLIEKGQISVDTGGIEAGCQLVLGDGDSFGEWSLLAPPHLTSVSARVTRESQVLVLEKEDFDKFAEGEPAIALKILRGIVGSVWSSIKDVERILKESL